MTARTHDLAAITSLGVVAILAPMPTISVATAIVAVLANLIGGITPDIDQPTAPLWRNLPVGKYIGKLFDKMLGGHRFITHSILGLVLFGFLSHLLLSFLHPILGSININVVWWAFMIGMVSHLAMDTITKESVPWLLPIPYKFGFPPIKSWRITTGSWVESYIIFPGIIIIAIWFYSHHIQSLTDILHQHIT